MRLIRTSALILLIASSAASLAGSGESNASAQGIRVLSWNVSGDAFASRQEPFNLMLRWANPDILLLDEVLPSTDPEDLVSHLASLSPGDGTSWNIAVGASGGRQRALIATRQPLTSLPEFTSIVPYPEGHKQRILEGMSEKERLNPDWSMEGGIPVNGAIVRTESYRLLVVVADLQCCGSGPDSWQELRRRIEARRIRELVSEVLTTHEVDGVILAGDFNMVNSTFPMALLLGPYPEPHGGLIPAEAYHSDGDTSWTWDGRGTPFPSNVLDYQLYSPSHLLLRSGTVLDSEGISTEAREALGLEVDTSRQTGRHRPIVVEYEWR